MAKNKVFLKDFGRTTSVIAAANLVPGYTIDRAMAKLGGKSYDENYRTSYFSKRMRGTIYGMEVMKIGIWYFISVGLVQCVSGYRPCF